MTPRGTSRPRLPSPILAVRGIRSGIAMGLVVVIITLLFLSVFTILHLMRGTGSQLTYADAHVRSLVIAESGVNLLLARLMSQPWEDRWFRDGPDYHGTPIPCEGGSFIYAIQDTPGATCTVDLWVKGEYRSTRRLLFYRVRYEDLLFKGLTSPAFQFAADLEGERAPSTLAPPVIDDLTGKMNELLDRKLQTRGQIADRWEGLADKVNPATILTALGANVPTEGIPAKSVAPPGVSTLVSPRPREPVPSGGSSNLANYDKNRLWDWIGKQGFDDEYAAYLRAAAVRNFMAIDVQSRLQRYAEAERIFKAFLKFLMRHALRVQGLRTTARMKYQAALDDLEAQAGSLTPEEYAARKAALYQDYRNELEGITNANPAP